VRSRSWLLATLGKVPAGPTGRTGGGHQETSAEQGARRSVTRWPRVVPGLARIPRNGAHCAGAAQRALASGDTPLPTLRSLLLRLIGQQNGAVSAEEIDRYLDALEEPKRTTLARLRQTILEILPEADQGISYGVPAFKVGGKTIAGIDEPLPVPLVEKLTTVRLRQAFPA